VLYFVSVYVSVSVCVSVCVVYLYNKSRYVCPFVCLSVSMFRMAGQTTGPIETKLDTRTHVHPGSICGKVIVKVIHVCVREWQKYETPGTQRHLANDYEAPSGGRVITANIKYVGLSWWKTLQRYCWCCSLCLCVCVCMWCKYVRWYSATVGVVVCDVLLVWVARLTFILDGICNVCFVFVVDLCVLASLIYFIFVSLCFSVFVCLSLSVCVSLSLSTSASFRFLSFVFHCFCSVLLSFCCCLFCYYISSPCLHCLFPFFFFVSCLFLSSLLVYF